MKYLVASVAKYHRPGYIFSHHTSKKQAKIKAKRMAKKHKNKFSVGIFGYTKDKYYGLLNSYD